MKKQYFEDADVIKKVFGQPIVEEKFWRGTLSPTEIPKKLKDDVFKTIGDIHRMNAPHAKGYLFSEKKDGTISRGMYCDRDEEITKDWDYYYDFNKKKFFEIS